MDPAFMETATKNMLHLNMGTTALLKKHVGMDNLEVMIGTMLFPAAVGYATKQQAALKLLHVNMISQGCERMRQLFAAVGVTDRSLRRILQPSLASKPQGWQHPGEQEDSTLAMLHILGKVRGPAQDLTSAIILAGVKPGLRDDSDFLKLRFAQRSLKALHTYQV